MSWLWTFAAWLTNPLLRRPEQPSPLGADIVRIFKDEEVDELVRASGVRMLADDQRVWARRLCRRSETSQANATNAAKFLAGRSDGSGTK